MHPTAIPRPLTVLALFVAMALAITLTPAIGTAQTDDPTPPPEAVVLARSDEPADALGAGPVAGILGAPVLLTPTAFLLDTTAEALQTIDPDLVILAGGEVALSADVEQSVNDLGYDTRRAAGSDRHETAALIAGLLAEFNTGRPLLSGAPITDDVIPGLNAERLDGMTLDDVLAAAEPEPADTIVLGQSLANLVANTNQPPTEVENLIDGARISGDGVVQIDLVSPNVIGAQDYALDSVEYCIRTGFATIEQVSMFAGAGVEDRPGFVATDDTERTDAGCYVFEVGQFAESYILAFHMAGGATPRRQFTQLQTTWVPVEALQN